MKTVGFFKRFFGAADGDSKRDASPGRSSATEIDNADNESRPRVKLLDGSWPDEVPPLEESDDAPPAWKVGDVVLDDYVVEARFDTGGMGLVYKVRSRLSGELFAAKSTRVYGAQGMWDFLVEIQTWIDLPEHPHLATCRFFRTVEDDVLVFSEYVEGGTLGEWIRTGRLTTLKQILDVAIQLAWSLSALHELGVVHQDVKPNNVLMTPTGTVKLTDFGLARAHDVARAAAPTKSGAAGATYRGRTPAYCSPEQEAVARELAKGTPPHRLPRLGPQTDMWSWGLCLFEMFAGGRTWREGPEAPGALERYLQQADAAGQTPLGMPTAVAELLRHCFRPGDGTGDRPASLDDAAETLRRVYRDTTKTEYARERPLIRSVQAAPVGDHARVSSTGLPYRNPRIFLDIAFREAGRDVAEFDQVLPPPARTRRARVLADINAFREARRIFAELVAQGRTDLELLSAEACGEEALACDCSDDLPGAVELFQTGIRIMDRLVNREGRDDLAERFAKLLTSAGVTFFRRGDRDGLVSANSVYVRAVEFYTHLIADQDRADLRPELANVYQHMSRIPRSLGNHQGALSFLDEAIEILSRASTLAPARVLSTLAHAWLEKAGVFHDMGNSRDALEVTDHAIARLEQENRREASLDLARILAIAYHKKGTILGTDGRTRPSLECFQKAVTIREQLVNERELRELASDLALSYMQQGIALSNLGATEDALCLFDKSIPVLDRLVRHEDRHDLVSDLVLVCENKAVGLRKSGKLSEAMDQLRQAIEMAEAEKSERLLAHCCLNAGMFSESDGNHEEALAFFDRAIDIFASLAFEQHVQINLDNLARSRVYRAACMFNLGDRERALREAEDTSSMLQREMVQKRRKDLREPLSLANELIRTFEAAATQGKSTAPGAAPDGELLQPERSDGPPETPAQDSPLVRELREALDRENRARVVELLQRGADPNARYEDGLRLLHMAARKDSRELAEVLVGAGAHVDAAAGNGATPLHFAARYGSREVTESLLASGATVDAVTDQGATPLPAAAQNGHLEVVRSLVDAHAEIDARGGGATALYLATQNAHQDVVRYLLKHGADADATVDRGITALWAAADHGDLAIVQQLVAHGAHVNAAMDIGVTPLWQAAQEGHVAVVRFLLKHGADTESRREEDGVTALWQAAHNGQTEVVRALLAHGVEVDAASRDQTTPLWIAAQNLHLDIVQALLEAGAELEAAREGDETALWHASQNAHLEVVNLLLQAGANVNTAMDNGVTVLWQACQQGHTDVVRALLDRGADVSMLPNGVGYAGDSRGRRATAPALWVACQEGHVEIVRLLLAKGANPHEQNSEGVSPLWQAAAKGQAEVVEKLLQHGADKDSPFGGVSALFMACQEGHAGVADVLLRRGADANFRHQSGATPLLVAAANGCTEVVRTLLKHGADPAAMTRDGQSPLSMAANRGHAEIVGLLAAVINDPG